MAWTSIRCSSYFLLFCLNSKYLHAVYILVCITHIGHFIRYKFSYLFRQITKLANHLAATQSIEACRHGEGDLLKFKASFRNGKRGDLSVTLNLLNMVIGARRAGLSI